MTYLWRGDIKKAAAEACGQTPRQTLERSEATAPPTLDLDMSLEYV